MPLLLVRHHVDRSREALPPKRVPVTDTSFRQSDHLQNGVEDDSSAAA